MAYGLPGKPGYSYTRPFDYFNFQFTASTANTFENIMTRGLLLGSAYAAGDSYRGVWGLYGSYDYISPQVFRVSSTALYLGTTAQWWLSRAVALQGTALGGVGYGAAGIIHSSGERDYHYGATPQGLLALRLLLGDMAKLNVTSASIMSAALGPPRTGGGRTSSAATRRSPCAFTTAMPSRSSTSRRTGMPTIPNCPTRTSRWEPSASPTPSWATPGSAPSSGAPAAPTAAEREAFRVAFIRSSDLYRQQHRHS